MENIRRDINKDLNTLLKEYIDRKLHEEVFKVYVGKVVNNRDPDKEGKCRVRVYGIYSEEIPDSDLPWAIPEFTFIGSKVGNFIVPPEDALVNIYFRNNDMYTPIYTSKVMQKNKLPSKRIQGYPNTMVFFETDEGDSMTLNRQTGITTFDHRSGLKIEISANGDVDVKGNTTVPLTNITIEPGLAGSVNIGRNAFVPCPDLPTCLLTGGPLALKTMIPGSMVNVP